MNVQSKPQRYEIANRYLFKGHLEMQTALHIGGGKFTLSHSNSPIVLTSDQEPFIPGSSFKGALRSSIEKLIPSLRVDSRLRSCGLMKRDMLIEAGNRAGAECPTARVEEIGKKIRQQPGNAEQIRKEEREKLCHTCQLFGSPFAAARMTVHDLFLVENEWGGAIEIRDGVAIDRDSENAKDGGKYDFEVVPASTAFRLTIALENATLEDRQILSLGLNDFMNGFGAIGGKRSRGLGACIIRELSVYSLELDEKDEQKRRQQWQNYLLKRDETRYTQEIPGQKFVDDHINEIFPRDSVEEQV